MTIEQIATELLELKDHFADIKRRYTAKRDQMQGALSTCPNQSLIQSGYRFQLTSSTQAVTVTKQSVIDALRAENFSEEEFNRIFGAALIESERFGYLRITPVVPT